MVRSLYELADDEITAEDFMKQAESYLLENPKDSEELVNALAISDRFDILETLKDHPVYGEKAKSEISMNDWMVKEKEQRKAREENYPFIFKKWLAVLRRPKRVGYFRVGYFGVSYPSMYAKECGVEGDFVAISGDGLFLFMLEVVSLTEPEDRNGQFRIVPMPVVPGGNRPKPHESSDSIAFRNAGKWQFGDVINGDQVTSALEEVYHGSATN